MLVGDESVGGIKPRQRLGLPVAAAEQRISWDHGGDLRAADLVVAQGSGDVSVPHRPALPWDFADRAGDHFVLRESVMNFKSPA